MEQEYERVAAVRGVRARQCGVEDHASVRAVGRVARLPPRVLPHLLRGGTLHCRRQEGTADILYILVLYTALTGRLPPPNRIAYTTGDYKLKILKLC